MTTPTSTLAPLNATFKRLHNFSHLASIAGWDQAAMMPSKGNEARAAAMAELQVLMHQTLTDPALKGHFDAAQNANLPEADQASLNEMRREWAMVNRLPQDLVEAQSLASARCEHAWRTQRKANDWQGFLGNFREVVQLARQEAKFLADATGSTPYEALMDKFEPGMREDAITQLFGEVKAWLPGLISQVIEKQKSETVAQATGPFAIDNQRALGVEVMGLLGFDFEGGRLDISTHPFCGGVPQDVRITTRYNEATFAPSLMGIIHETGHARYEQRLPRDTLHLPVGRARSMGIHESQSLSFEMQLARNPAFLQLIAPLVKKHLGGRDVEIDQHPDHEGGQAGGRQTLAQSVGRQGVMGHRLARQLGVEDGDVILGHGGRARDIEDLAALALHQGRGVDPRAVFAADIGPTNAGGRRIERAAGHGLGGAHQQQFGVEVVAQDGPAGDGAGGQGLLGPEVVVDHPAANLGPHARRGRVDQVRDPGRLRGGYRGAMLGNTVTRRAQAVGADQQKAIDASEGGGQRGGLVEVNAAGLDATLRKVGQLRRIAAGCDQVGNAGLGQQLDHASAQLTPGAGDQKTGRGGAHGIILVVSE